MAKFSTADLRALAGLTRLMVGLDKRYDADESAHLERIAEEFGADDFWAQMQASYDADTSEEGIWDLAEAVIDKDAQEAIYGNLFELSIAGGIDEAEGNLLDTLADLWGLEIEKFDADDPGRDEEE